MALATLQDAVVPAVTPIWRLSLSHSPDLVNVLPHWHEPLFPQFIKNVNTPYPLLHEASPQTLFKVFRDAGPLVSIRVGEDVGYAQSATVIEFWDDKHANVARNKNPALQENIPPFTLRTFNPCKLYCAVSRWSGLCVCAQLIVFRFIRTSALHSTRLMWRTCFEGYVVLVSR